MKNKIVHILDVFPSKSETFIINSLIESINNGYEYQIIANKIIEIENSSQIELLKKYNLYENAETYNISIPKNKFFRIIKAIYYLFIYIKYFKMFFKTLNYKKYGNKSRSLKLWYQVAFFLKYHKIKVFHAHFGINGTLLSTMKDLGVIKGKIIVSFYGYDTFIKKENRSELINFYKILFKYVDKIIVSSKYLYDNLILLKAPINKIIVNHVGVDQNLFKFYERNNNEEIKIISVGRLIKLKGHEFGIKAVHNLILKGYKVNYTIVGDGKLYQELKGLIKSLEIDNYVHLYGNASQNEIINLLYNHDIFLMTSIADDDGRQEGQGLVVAEAQSTGLPVVAFDSGGVKETIIDNTTGFLVKERDYFEMANKIEFLINNKDVRNRFAKKANKLVSKSFNNHIQSKNILKIYEELF